MTRYYYYVSAGAQCDEQTKIYTVAIGQSKQSQRDYAFLLTHATANGHYFEIRSAESSDFILRLRHSLVQFGVQQVYLTARDLVKLFRDAEASPMCSGQLASAHHQAIILSSSYRISSNLSRRSASPAKRLTSKT